MGKAMSKLDRMAFREWWNAYQTVHGSPAFKRPPTVRHAVKAAFEAGFEAGQKGLIRGLCAWCENPVASGTGGLSGDGSGGHDILLYCDGCDEKRTT
jgi:hypothetical protein